jgi:hypothetical protein
MRITLDKFIKISIIIGILVISFSVFYYLIFFLPKKETSRLNSEKQNQLIKEEEKIKKEENELQIKITKCSEDAKKFHQDYINSIKGYYFEPKYNYNKYLNKCLYSGGYREDKITGGYEEIKNNKSYWERIIKDVHTNETILSAYNFYDSEQITKFWEKHNELMKN